MPKRELWRIYAPGGTEHTDLRIQWRLKAWARDAIIEKYQLTKNEDGLWLTPNGDWVDPDRMAFYEVEAALKYIFEGYKEGRPIRPGHPRMTSAQKRLELAAMTRKVAEALIVLRRSPPPSGKINQAELAPLVESIEGKTFESGSSLTKYLQRRGAPKWKIFLAIVVSMADEMERDSPSTNSIGSN